MEELKMMFDMDKVYAVSVSSVLFLCGFLLSLAIFMYALHRIKKRIRKYDEVRLALQQVVDFQVAYCDTQERGKEMMNLIRKHRELYIDTGLVSYDKRNARKHIPWVFGNLDWELTALIDFLNHIGLDIEIRTCVVPEFMGLDVKCDKKPWIINDVNLRKPSKRKSYVIKPHYNKKIYNI